MAMCKYITVDGKPVPYAAATVPVHSAAVKYGASVFEGLRAYWNAEQGELHVFRLREHMVRLIQSMKIMRFKTDISVDALCEQLLVHMRANAHKADCHIRFNALVVGEGAMDTSAPIQFACVSEERSAKAAADKAISAQISSWRRIDDTTMPPRVKSAANYNNGRFGTLQARADGYGEPIFLTQQGKVAESGGSCLFMLRDGVPATPTVTGGILESVTRASLITLFARKFGKAVQEREIDRTELYVADELFLCGSAYEITPIVDLDRLPIADGKVGADTVALWRAYDAVVRGRDNAFAEWRTPVYGGPGARVSV